MDDFANRLKNTRLALGLSQKQFGALGGVSDSAQGYYENTDPNKQREPSINYLLQLKENEVDIYYLLTGEKVKSDLNVDESLILETFRNSNEQSQKLILDLCRTLSGLPEQSKKKDDQDPPKEGSSKNISDISAGGNIGDVMLDSVKNTTYNITDNRTKYELDLDWEEASEKIDGQERFVRALTKAIVCIGLLLFMGEMLSHSKNPTNELEQIYELLFIVGLPIVMAFALYREVSKKITLYFKNKRNRVKRDIYLG